MVTLFCFLSFYPYGWYNIPIKSPVGDSIYHSAVACTQSCFIKQACIYTTEDTIVCDEICIHTTFHTNICMDLFSKSSSPMKCKVSTDFEPGTSGFQSEDDTTAQKGLTRKCGRITSATTLDLD